MKEYEQKKDAFSTSVIDDPILQIQRINLEQNRLMQILQQHQTQYRKLAKRVWQVQENERSRIAQELHDGIGQMLTAMIHQIEKIDTPEGKQVLSMAQQALDDTRELSRLLRPKILDDLGLEAALNWLTRTLSHNSDLSIQLHVDECNDLSLDLQTLVFRITQEALTNSIKHANATHCIVRLKKQEPGIHLDIVDDGKGFIVSSVNDGFGLESIKDRVSAYEGQMTIDSQPNCGCRLLFVIPLEERVVE